jgi:hypothetical protein
MPVNLPKVSTKKCHKILVNIGKIYQFNENLANFKNAKNSSQTLQTWYKYWLIGQIGKFMINQ